jgi:hypothetical protein
VEPYDTPDSMGRGEEEFPKWSLMTLLTAWEEFPKCEQHISQIIINFGTN